MTNYQLTMVLARAVVYELRLTCDTDMAHTSYS